MENTQTNWSLTEIYPSFESGEFLADFNGLPEEIDAIKRFAEENFSGHGNAAEALREYILKTTSFYRKAMRLCDYCGLVLSTDAEDKTALNYLEKIESALTEVTAPETKFSRFLKNIGEAELDGIIDTGEVLKEHAFFLRETQRDAQYTLSEAEEIIISKLETTGSSAWEKYQDNVMATLTAEIEQGGERKRLPFAEIRNLAFDKSAETRKKAYDAEIAACKAVAKACAAALNGIKGEALTVSKLRGYESPLHMTVLNSRLDMEVLDALIASMRKNAGVFAPYFKKKAELLGHENGKLPFWDLFAPIGSDMRFTYDEAVAFVGEKLGEFIPELGGFVKKAAEGGWIDVYPKEGKRGGAFCQNLHYLGESRFLLNFNGSVNDALTLAHELGHGFHGDCLKNEAFLNSDYPMPIAETASTLCETLVVNAALKNASHEQGLALLENGISGNAQVIVDILSRFIFESKLFERRADGSLSAEELCVLMREAQLEAYGDALDADSLHEYMWVVKPHYYSAGSNFYNFPYAFGTLFSNALYGLFVLNGQEFSGTYKKMLAATGRADLADVAKIAGLDIRDEKFWDSSFEPFKRDIEKFCCY